MLLRRALFMLFVFIATSSAVHAQIHGLTLIDTADSPGKGALHLAAGGFKAETSKLYGGRIGYGATDRMLVFADLGVHDADHFDSEFLGQAGMRYTLPLDLPFDLAVRATTIPYIASYEHYLELTFNLLASRYLDDGKNWAVYAAVGLDRQWWELEVPLDPATAAFLGQDTYVDKGNRTDVATTVGISLKIFGASRFFLEASNIDENYGCAGIRFEL